MSGFHMGAALTGLVFVAVGAAFLLDEAGVLRLDTRIILPAVLIALGVAAVVNALLRRDQA